MNRTTAMIVTVLTALFCGCLALFSCVWGVLIAVGMPINTELNGVQSTQTLPAPIGFALLCASVILILIPIAVGFFTLRKAPALSSPALNADEPLPPPS